MDKSRLNKLKEILATMSTPDNRVEKVLTTHHIFWLSRNLRSKNHTHPRIEEAMELIKELLKE